MVMRYDLTEENAKYKWNKYIHIKLLWALKYPNAYMRSWHYRGSVYHTHICVGGTPGVKSLVKEKLSKIKDIDQ